METQELPPEYTELASKMKQMDETLNKNIFSNPIREIQEQFRKDLLDIKQTFINNLNDYTKIITGNSNSSALPSQIVSNDEISKLKTELEHKRYQAEALKKAFTEYEDKVESELNGLKTENSKLKYRIEMLLKTIEELEGKK